mgnify:CR=1 FL=1
MALDTGPLHIPLCYALLPEDEVSPFLEQLAVAARSTESKLRGLQGTFMGVVDASATPTPYFAPDNATTAAAVIDVEELGTLVALQRWLAERVQWAASGAGSSSLQAFVGTHATKVVMASRKALLPCVPLEYLPAAQAKERIQFANKALHQLTGQSVTFEKLAAYTVRQSNCMPDVCLWSLPLVTATTVVLDAPPKPGITRNAEVHQAQQQLLQYGVSRELADRAIEHALKQDLGSRGQSEVTMGPYVHLSMDVCMTFVAQELLRQKQAAMAAKARAKATEQATRQAKIGAHLASQAGPAPDPRNQRPAKTQGEWNSKLKELAALRERRRLHKEGLPAPASTAAAAAAVAQAEPRAINPIDTPELYIEENLRAHTWTVYQLETIRQIRKHMGLVARAVQDGYRRRSGLGPSEAEHRFNHSNPFLEFQLQQLEREGGLERVRERVAELERLADKQPKQQPKQRLEQRPPPPPPAARARAHIVTIRDLPLAPPAPGASEDRLSDILRATTELDYQASHYNPVGLELAAFTDGLLRYCGLDAAADPMIKLRAIWVWIVSAHHRRVTYDIAYVHRDNSHGDTDAGYRRVANNVLETRKAVCAGFAILLLEMLKIAGVSECLYVVGWTKLNKSAYQRKDDFNDQQRKLMSGHAWIVVSINGLSYFCDPTWSSGADPNYFLVPPIQALNNFFPEDPAHQCLPEDQRWDLARFLDTPLLYPHFYRSQLELEAMDDEWGAFRSELARCDNLVRNISLSFPEFALVPALGEPQEHWRAWCCCIVYWCTSQAETLDLGKIPDARKRRIDGHFQRIPLQVADPRNQGVLRVCTLDDVQISPPPNVIAAASTPITHVLVRIRVSHFAPQPGSLVETMDTLFVLK